MIYIMPTLFPINPVERTAAVNLKSKEAFVECFMDFCMQNLFFFSVGV